MIMRRFEFVDAFISFSTRNEGAVTTELVKETQNLRKSLFDYVSFFLFTLFLLFIHFSRVLTGDPTLLASVRQAAKYLSL